MAPIKFEEQIKDKLTQRTIQPSNEAWDKLSEKLNTEDKKNSRRIFFYVGIAASIVGVLFLTSLMFTASKADSVSPIVVETQQNTTPITETAVIPKTKVATTTSEEDISNENKKETSLQIASSINNEPRITENSKQPIANQPLNKDIIKPIAQKNLVSQQTNATAFVENSKSPQEIIKPANVLTFEDAKAFQVAVEIQKLEIENGTVTDAEIEDLLKQAEKEILRHRIFNETTRTVDAEALLQDVEKDLEQSFRTKVFESLKSSYKTVKTAVAGRNN